RAVHRRREPAIFPGKSPLLLGPEVEGMEQRRHQGMVVAEALLDHRGEGGKHQGGVDALAIHDGDAALAAAPFRRRAHHLAGHFTQAKAFGILRPVPLLVGAGPGHHLEGGIGNVLRQSAADHQLLAALDIDEEKILLEFLGEVAQEGLLRLVEVIVGVVDGIGQLGHGILRGSALAGSSAIRARICSRHWAMDLKPGRSRQNARVWRRISASGRSRSRGSLRGWAMYQSVSANTSSRLPSGSWKYRDQALPWVTGSMPATPVATSRR